MKKFVLSIGSFALSLSALNAAQLDLPENASGKGAVRTQLLAAEAMASPLPGDAAEDPFITAVWSSEVVKKDSTTAAEAEEEDGMGAPAQTELHDSQDDAPSA